MLLEIASWLEPADCYALAACRRRMHALASFTEVLLPWRWAWRQQMFLPLQHTIHARRWRRHLQQWKDRAMRRAERVTVETHFFCNGADGLQPLVVRHDDEQTSLWFKFRRRTPVTKLVEAAEDRMNMHDLWPHTISLELTRSDGGTVGIFGPGIASPRFPIDITADEKLVLVAHMN